MNLMYFVLSDEKFSCKNKKIANKIESLKEKFKKTKIKISDKFTKLNNTFYYNNCLPYMSKDRDVLKKPTELCKIYVNWKKKPLNGMTTEEIISTLKPQWGWTISTVDAEHTRNKFKNKNDLWVVFDSEAKAKEAMQTFNSLFITAIELDAIEEYKRFKENPEKRPLTFDKLVPNYAELYDAVDNHEI